MMQRTALIVQIECAVMVIPVGVGGIRSDMRMAVGFNRHGLIHIQGVLVDQRDNTRHLRNHEHRQQGCVNPSDCSHKRHETAIALPGPIVGETDISTAAGVPHCETISDQPQTTWAGANRQLWSPVST